MPLPAARCWTRPASCPGSFCQSAFYGSPGQGFINIRRDPDLADALGKNEMNPALNRLLITLQTRRQLARVKAAKRRQGSIGADTFENGVFGFPVEQIRHSRQYGGGPHAPSDRLAVKKPRVCRFRFKRMPKRVPEIQDSPQPSLFFVGADYVSFNPHRIRDHAIDNVGVAREYLMDGTAHYMEQIRICDHPMLDYLEQSSTVFPLRKCFENGGIH